MATQDRTIACTVGWGENAEAQIRTTNELEALLDGLAETHRGDEAVLAEITLSNGDALSIGLGHSRSVLSFVPGSGLPPYMVSRGPTESGAGLSFYYYGRWTHFEEQNLVSICEAREAARYFVVEGRLVDSVTWQEV